MRAQQPVRQSPSVSPSAAPLEHSRPKLAGCSGSPRDARRPLRPRRRSRRRNRGRWCGRRSRRLRRRRAAQADMHVARRRAAPATVGAQPSSGATASPVVELDHPVVQRAGRRRRPCTMPSRQRARLVRAAVDAARRRRSSPVRKTAIGRPRLADAQPARAAARDVVERARRSIQSAVMSRRHADRRRAARTRARRRPAARSAQGSFCAKRCECRKRACSAVRPSASSTSRSCT